MSGINHIKEKYGVYTIIEKLNKRANDGHSLYIGQCECGATKCGTLSNFKYNFAKKCPHYSRYGEIVVSNRLFNNQRIAHIFHGMLKRCYIESDKDYSFYGKKGIKICEEWILNPAKFELWSLNNGYKDGLTIDRLNEDKDYCPENCRWITKNTNARFKSNTNYITATVTLSGRQWASLIPDVSVNYINKLMRDKGEKEAVDFIECKLKDKRIS